MAEHDEAHGALHALPVVPEKRAPAHFAHQRDQLRIVRDDEGGALVVSDDAQLIALVREMRWRALFWDHRERVKSAMRFVVLGHAVLEQALNPWPGITCRAVFVSPASDLDAQAAAQLGVLATPRDLAPLPVFGYPGWLAANEGAEFYDDARYFRSRA